MKLDKAHRRTAARSKPARRCGTDVPTALQALYRRALWAGNAENHAGSVTYGYGPECRLRHATNARVGSTFILVVASTFYVPQPCRLEGGDGLAGRVFGDPDVACGEVGDRRTVPSRIHIDEHVVGGLPGPGGYDGIAPRAAASFRVEPDSVDCTPSPCLRAR